MTDRKAFLEEVSLRLVDFRQAVMGLLGKGRGPY